MNDMVDFFAYMILNNLFKINFIWYWLLIIIKKDKFALRISIVC